LNLIHFLPFSSYFRKYRLYQYIFDTLFVVSIKQISPNAIELPKAPLALHEGYLVEPPLVATTEDAEGQNQQE
jgi:hypothetical protein